MKQSIGFKNEQTLSYAAYGDPTGYPIFVQHGLIASIEDVHLFDQLIHAGARLICAARPGYGDSSAYWLRNVGEWGEILMALADELELAQFDILGISSGAPYAYAAAYQMPDRARHLFILSGTPALYDEAVLRCWPYPVQKNADMTEMQKLAHELFFAHLTQADLAQADVRDSMRNDCFGIAQDLKIRCMDWDFNLSDITTAVCMRHSRSDTSVPWITAEMTAHMLPNCQFETREKDDHFSQEVLDDFIQSVIVPIRSGK